MLQPPPCLPNGLLLLSGGILSFVSKALTVFIRLQNLTWNGVAYLYAFKQIKFLHKDNQNYSNYRLFQKNNFELPCLKIKCEGEKKEKSTVHQTLKLFSR